MVLSIAEHKAIIFNLFLEKEQEKQFPLERLAQAASLKKKLYDNAKEEKKEGVLVGINWSDGDLELTLDESSLAKELFTSIQTARPSEHEALESLKQLFDK